MLEILNCTNHVPAWEMIVGMCIAIQSHCCYAEMVELLFRLIRYVASIDPCPCQDADILATVVLAQAVRELYFSQAMGADIFATVVLVQYVREFNCSQAIVG